MKEPNRSPIFLNTRDAKEIKATSVRLQADVRNPDGGEITNFGFYWALNDSATSILNNKITLGPGAGSFEYLLHNLRANSSYSFFSYATSDGISTLGNVKSFNTLPFQTPKLVTDTVKNIQISTALFGANITYDGGKKVTERGFCWGENKSPTIKDLKVRVGDGAGKYAIVLSQLKENTRFFVRAYAVNSIGIAYGNEINFTTLDYRLIQLKTSAATDIGIFNVTLNGEVLDNGGGNILERGFFMSTSPEPSATDMKFASSQNMLGAMKTVVTNLEANTTYYFRAYAKNEKGYSLGDVLRFITLDINYPEVITMPTTNISYTSATFEAEILNDGGGPILERGFCFSIQSNPTIQDNKYPISGDIGVFKVVMTKLQSGTTYYVRSFAKNKKGIQYGNQVIFTTPTIPPPPPPITPPSTSNPIVGPSNPVTPYIGCLNYAKSSAPASVKIGDNYQGGIIAYIFRAGDPGYIQGEYHGLIVSTGDFPQLSPGLTFGCWISNGQGISVNTGSGILNGCDNTANALSACTAVAFPRAAKVCIEFNGGGFSDWYLPSSEELKKVEQVKGLLNLFWGTMYISSTQSSDESCVGITFYAENNSPPKENPFFEKGAIGQVRAMRRF